MKINYEIRRAKAEVEEELFNYEGVTGVGVGEKITDGEHTGIPSIRVYVKEKNAKSKLKNDQIVPEEINGFPTDVIEREFELHSLSVPVDSMQLQVDTGRYNPLTGGISLGPCRVINNHIYAGTLGLVIEDNNTDQPMLLSNFHVMCVDTGWSVGDSMAQPSRIDGGLCPSDVVGKLARAHLGGQVDGAIAKIVKRDHNCRITEIGKVNGKATPVHNEPVRKRGRTTRLTYGFVDDVSLSVRINYGDGLGTKTLMNQIGISVDSSQSNKFGDHGDSGSIVVNQDNKVIGLYFAGNSDGSAGVANPIGAVFSALNVHLCSKESCPDCKIPPPDSKKTMTLDFQIEQTRQYLKALEDQKKN